MDGVTLGERIRLRRKALGWTLDRLAYESERSKTFLSEVECGKRSIGAETALNLSKALGVSVDDLLAGNGTDALPPVFSGCPEDLAVVALEQELSFRTVRTLLRLRAVLAAHHGGKLPEAYRVDWLKLWTAVAPWLEE